MRWLIVCIVMLLSTSHTPPEPEYGIEWDQPYCVDPDEMGTNWCSWCIDGTETMVSFWYILGEWHMLETEISCGKIRY